MTQPNILELAKQGDVEAIASLMNRHLQPKGITAKVAFKDACLEIILESAEIPNQETWVAFLRRGLTNLGAASVDRVKVYGQHTGKEFPAWSQEFELGFAEAENDDESSNNPQMLTVSINLNGDSVRELKSQDFENIANKIINDILSSCKDVFIQKVSISNDNCVISKER
ncbi:hypothetical protein IQ276_009720 [Desmonostoc muscorum LEGE 12446]|uniref:Uncharacterized protein n=1 Tax=Desmonostoc muscorum LEGE 12446 TaxID=1828758 RepID=A0A8J7DFY4_DESMC|nr:hypothetical protein [Desmonostoc muscorum]MCF2146725.1 hypothetical protein [Desmonostoc muscorum LEGE 12446]